MFYTDLVQIPAAPGKLIRRKEHLATYVLYEYDRMYDKKTQKTNPKRRIIGKVSEEDPALMYPNDKYFEYFEGAKIVPVRGNAVHSAAIKAGAYIVLTEIINELKLNDYLEPFFGDKTGLLLDLALYSIITEDNAAQHYPDYAFNHPLLTDKMCIYSDSTLSIFIGDITPEKRSGFINAWNASMDKEQKIYVSYDSTNKNCQGKKISSAEYGHAKDHKSKPIVNLTCAYNQTNQVPLDYESYCGSINDMSQFEYFVQKLSKHGYMNFGLILDRGYFDEYNIQTADAMDVGVIIMAKGKEDFFGAIVDSVKGSFEGKYDKKMGGWNTYGTTVVRKIFDSDTRERYIHVYYNMNKAAAEEAAFYNRLKEYEDDIKNHIGFKYTPSSNVMQYFTLTKDNDGVLVNYAKNVKAIEKRISRCGTYCIVTTEPMGALEAFTFYKGRDCSEKLFRTDKSFIGGNCIRVRSDNSMQGKIFIEFIALVIRNRMHNLIKELIVKRGKKLNYYNVSSAIAELEKIELVRCADGTYSLDHAITKKQRELLAAFGISEEEALTRLGSVMSELSGIDKKLMQTEGVRRPQENEDDEIEDDDEPFFNDDEDDEEDDEE